MSSVTHEAFLNIQFNCSDDQLIEIHLSVLLCIFFIHRDEEMLGKASLTRIWLFSYSGFQINNQWLQGKETNYYEK